MVPSFGQDPCQLYAGGLFGKEVEGIQSASLATIPGEEGFYLGGVKNDSALIIRFNGQGKILWAKTLDVVPNLKDNINSLFVDSDHMLVVGGTNGPLGVGQGGPVFILKYDPQTDQVIWATELVPEVNRSYCWTVVELGPGDHYLMSNNPTDDVTPNVDAELIEIDRNSGLPVVGKGKRIHVGGSEDITNLLLYEGSLYGTGRFTDGLPNTKMRTALIKMDADDRTLDWVKLGHQPQSQNARLYGVDLILDGDFIYVCSLGDPTGTSTTNTKLFVQKFTLDGTFLWLKGYDFPGNNDWGYEMIGLPDGMVIMGAQKAAPQQFILFKINFDGELTWASTFPTGEAINPVSPLIGDSQLIRAGDKFVFTGYTATHFLVILTDLEGIPVSPCIPYQRITFPVNTVPGATFYDVVPNENIPDNTVIQRTLVTKNTGIYVDPACLIPVVLNTQLDTTICQGMDVEGYTLSGIYQDTFLSLDGCDSVRTLNLNITDIVESTLVMTICSGDQYMGYSEPGIYQDTFISVKGCDSVRTLNLNITDIVESSLVKTICSGDQYMGYSEPGIYQDTFTSAKGCDSVRTLNLNITDVLESTLEKTICAGDQYMGYSDQGTYQDTFSTLPGCDSIRTLELLVLPVQYTMHRIGLCEAAILHYYTPGIYQDTFTAVTGCDSISRIQVDQGTFYIPNIFSPNGDAVNDDFEIIQSVHSDVTLTYFALFDRFGNMAYETLHWPVKWDGTNKAGLYHNPGVFTYVLKYDCSGNQITEYGDVTLVR